MSSGPRGCRVFVMCQLYKQTTQTDHWKGAHTCHQTTTDSRMSNTFKVFCLLIDHKGTPLGELFSVSCLTSETVSDLKKKVKEETPNDLDGVDAHYLTVWRCMDELDETDPTALASRCLSIGSMPKLVPRLSKLYLFLPRLQLPWVTLLSIAL